MGTIASNGPEPNLPIGRKSVSKTYGYTIDLQPLGELDEIHGAPSQMAIFERREAA